MAGASSTAGRGGDFYATVPCKFSGAVECRHRDIKASLKAALVQMANSSVDKWVDRLPWVMLFRRSMIQRDLQTSPAHYGLVSYINKGLGLG